MTPTAAITLPLQKTVTNLDTMEQATIKKSFTFVPVENTQQALERVGNDAKKFLALINEGLQAETRRLAAAEPTGWFATDEDGEITANAFTGTIGDPKAVNALVLTLAKTVFGYDSNADLASRNAAKANAMAMIKNTPAIREGLRKSAAMAPASDTATS